jgi:hypothetical protein
MTRFIVIERATGCIYGDTARFGAAGDVVSFADAVCLIDRHAGRPTRSFGYVRADSDAAQYDVYEIQPASSYSPSASDEEAQTLIREHGSLANSLASYNC